MKVVTITLAVTLAACTIDPPPKSGGALHTDAALAQDAPPPSSPVPLFQTIEAFDQAVSQGAHPLDKLPEEIVAHLRESLVFQDGRLATMDYEFAREALSPQDYIDFMYELGIAFQPDDPRFAGIPAPHPTAPQPGRDYCPLHGPPVLGAAPPPPLLPNLAAIDAAITRGDTPLADLPDEALAEWRAGLGANPGGPIHSMNYALLVEHIGEEKAARVLRMVGGDAEMDYANMICAQRGSCAPKFGWICIGSNCVRP